MIQKEIRCINERKTHVFSMRFTTQALSSGASSSGKSMAFGNSASRLDMRCGQLEGGLTLCPSD
jgi:hypothetical protein